MKFLEEESFINQGEKKMFLCAEKRKRPLNEDAETQDQTSVRLSDEEAVAYFHNHYKSSFFLRRGDVLVMNFYSSCGYELKGNHFVAVINETRVNNPLVTVVPLKSEKEGKDFNPASDVPLGEINGILNGRRALAVVNQIRTVDKSRLFEPEVLRHIDEIYNSDKKEIFSVKTIQIKNLYRLTRRQYRSLVSAVVNFLTSGFIKH